MEVEALISGMARSATVARTSSSSIGPASDTMSPMMMCSGLYPLKMVTHP